MRKIFAILVIAVVFGGIATAFQHRNDGVDTSKQISDATDEYVTRKLANGVIIQESARALSEGDLVEISPAAGEGVAGRGDGAPSVEGQTHYKYDPLTQTYRRIDVDTGANSSQDIIRDPTHP